MAHTKITARQKKSDFFHIPWGRHNYLIINKIDGDAGCSLLFSPKRVQFGSDPTSLLIVNTTREAPPERRLTPRMQAACFEALRRRDARTNIFHCGDRNFAEYGGEEGVIICEILNPELAQMFFQKSQASISNLGKRLLFVTSMKFCVCVVITILFCIFAMGASAQEIPSTSADESPAIDIINCVVHVSNTPTSPSDPVVTSRSKQRYSIFRGVGLC